jgi:predicted Zn-dependent peptidase
MISSEVLNRKKQPPIYEVEHIHLPKHEVFYLDNQIPVYVVNLALQDIVKVEVVFHAGRPFEKNPLASRATASLVKDGTSSMNSAEIAEKIDYYGGTLSTPFSLDTSSVILQSLNKYFEELMPLLAEIIQDATFPEKEIETFVENNIQGLQVDLSKGEMVAYREISEKIFGADHPYGYNSNEQLYRSITRAMLLQHYQDNFNAANCCIFVSGKVNDSMLKTLNRELGQMRKGIKNIYQAPAVFTKPEHLFIEKKDSSQTAIKIGRGMFDRKHPDYTAFYALNTILGGYFGSRLMTNIREEKGFTYNIYSTIDPMHYDGYFYAATEVGNEYIKPTIEEIYKEIEILQNDLISKTELKMVKNYLLGNILTMIDGPFNVAEIIKSYVIEDIDVNQFQHSIDILKNITAKQLRDLAQKYLKKEDLWQVIVGCQ